MVPGRPASSCERRGALALLSDAASSIVCGGAAGMIMWSVVPPCLHGSTLCSSGLLVVCGIQNAPVGSAQTATCVLKHDMNADLGYWQQSVAADAAAKHCQAAAANPPWARICATTWAPLFYC